MPDGDRANILGGQGSVWLGKTTTPEIDPGYTFLENGAAEQVPGQGIYLPGSGQ